MTSPFRSPALHDRFALLDGSKELIFPGAARVSAGMEASNDAQQVPNGGTALSSLNEAAGTVQVSLILWTHEQWLMYQDRLAVLRRPSNSGGPAVFLCAHPEVRARKIKRLYFDNEKAEPYSAAEGYKITLTFKEKIKAPASSSGSGSGEASNLASYDTTTPSTAPSGPTLTHTAEGDRLAAAASQRLLTGEKRAGLCSVWQRQVWQDTHGGDRSLYGGTAKETEARFRAAGYAVPWSAAVLQGLQPGDQIFYGNDPSGYGHVGTFLGLSDKGVAQVAGNNLVTYRARGGLFDAAGRPTGYDKAGREVDARGVVELGALGEPTSVGKPQKVKAALFQGPVQPVANVPTPKNAPSNTPPGPPPGAYPMGKKAKQPNIFTPTGPRGP